jgi:hypothetical protein
MSAPVPTKSGDPKGKLIPVKWPRKAAKLGKKDESVLRIVCNVRDSAVGRQKEMFFKNIPWEQIDWNNRAHIEKINSWSSQVYGRANLGSKSVHKWGAEEDLWIGMYHLLVLKECHKRPEGVKMPKLTLTLKAFNDFFKGKTLYKYVGKNNTKTPLPVRGVRQYSSFAAKVNRLAKKIKDQVLVIHATKEGEAKPFRPLITEDLFHDYVYGGEDDRSAQLEQMAWREGQLADIYNKKAFKEFNPILESLPDWYEENDEVVDSEDGGEADTEDETHIKAEEDSEEEEVPGNLNDSVVQEDTDSEMTEPVKKHVATPKVANEAPKLDNSAGGYEADAEMTEDTNKAPTKIKIEQGSEPRSTKERKQVPSSIVVKDTSSARPTLKRKASADHDEGPHTRPAREVKIDDDYEIDES